MDVSVSVCMPPACGVIRRRINWYHVMQHRVRRGCCCCRRCPQGKAKNNNTWNTASWWRATTTSSGKSFAQMGVQEEHADRRQEESRHGHRLCTTSWKIRREVCGVWCKFCPSQPPTLLLLLLPDADMEQRFLSALVLNCADADFNAFWLFGLQTKKSTR